MLTYTSKYNVSLYKHTDRKLCVVLKIHLVQFYFSKLNRVGEFSPYSILRFCSAYYQNKFYATKCFTFFLTKVSQFTEN